MGLLSWLFGRTGQTDEYLPPPAPGEFAGRAIVVPTHDPNPEVIDPPEASTDALENFYCELEYTDSSGAFSSRPITMLSINRDGSYPCLVAVCHMRRAVRTFRIDRIKAVVTSDGEVFKGQSFFTSTLGLHLPTPLAENQRPKPERTENRREFRDIILPALTVLVACGKADGHLHPEEVDRIMLWTENEAIQLAKAGIIARAMTIEEAKALGKTITSMRPQARTLQRHMLAALAMPPGMLMRFRRALQQVIHADGIVHDQEAEFMEEFDRLAEQAQKNPEGLRRTVGEVFPTPAGSLPTVDLAKAIFVFTGQLSSMGRDEAQALVKARNDIVKSSPVWSEHYRNSYMVIGEQPGAKAAQAREIGMHILTEGEFRAKMGIG